MKKDLFPWIGSLPLSQISPPLLLHTLRRIEGRGANETAHTLRQTSSQVFRYGIATGRCERNPAADLHGALRPIIVKHTAAVLEPSGVGALMRAIAAYSGQPLTPQALECRRCCSSVPETFARWSGPRSILTGGSKRSWHTENQDLSVPRMREPSLLSNADG